MTKVAAVVIAMIALLPSSAARPSSSRCLAGMRNALVAGHFTGPLVCDKSRATFSRIGSTAGSGYDIYDYRYRYLPKDGNVMHGGQKIVIFHADKYVGQYALSPPPYVSMAVRGARLVLEVAATGEKVKLDLSTKLPATLFVGGEEAGLYR